MFTLCSALKLCPPIRCTSRNHRRRRVYGLSYTERSHSSTYYLVQSPFNIIGTNLWHTLTSHNNYRQMTHDEDVYTDPFAFKPERFLEENGHVPEPDSRAVAFGFGRRCVLPLCFSALVNANELLGFAQEKNSGRVRYSSLLR